MVEAQSIPLFDAYIPLSLSLSYFKVCHYYYLLLFLSIFLVFALSIPNKGWLSSVAIMSSRVILNVFITLCGLQELIHPPYWGMHSNGLKHALQILTNIVGTQAHGQMRANIFHHFSCAHKTSRYGSHGEKRVKVRKCTYLIRIKFPIQVSSWDISLSSTFQPMRDVSHP